jgi:hypothetical protein
MPRRKLKIKSKIKRMSERFPRSRRLSTFRHPGGEITELDLLRLSDKTGLTYGEIQRIYKSMKDKR